MSHHFDLRADPSASDSSLFMLLRPRWPYILGAIAGALFGVCVLLFLVASYLAGDPGEMIVVAMYGAILTSILLGIAWCGVLRSGQGGAGPIAGSFAFPLAITYTFLWARVDTLLAHAALVAAALAAFGWGHVVAPLNGVVRALAAASATLWTFQFISMLERWDMPLAIQAVSFVALSLLGVGLAFSFPPLRRARPAHTSQAR